MIKFTPLYLKLSGFTQLSVSKCAVYYYANGHLVLDV